MGTQNISNSTHYVMLSYGGIEMLQGCPLLPASMLCKLYHVYVHENQSLMLSQLNGTSQTTNQDISTEISKFAPADKK